MIALRKRKKWCLKSVEDYIVVVLFGVILLVTIVLPLDGDTWWHLRAGEITLAQRRPLVIDVFSFTKFGEPWASHEWLSELWMYISWRLGGFLGLSAWIGILGFLTAIIIYHSMQGAKIYKAFLVLLSSMLLSPFYLARPQMATMLLIALTAYIVDRYRENAGDEIYWLIPLFVLWSNLHGGFVIGFIYLLIVFVGDILDSVWHQREGSGFNKTQRANIAIVFIISALVVMIHPLGPGVWLTLVNTLNPGAGSEKIVEWSSPNFHIFSQQVFLWFALFLFITLIFSFRRVRWFDLLPILFFVISGFIWQRQLIFLGIFGPILLSRYLQPAYSNLVEANPVIKKWHAACCTQMNRIAQIKPSRVAQVLLLLLASLVYAGAIIKWDSINRHTKITQAESEKFPRAALEWIITQQPQGRMMNSYNWGGYFEWYLRDYPVFVDSRADLFSGEILGQWLQVMNADGDWQAILDRWQINLIVIEPDWTIAKVLPYAGWIESYRDTQSVIFTRGKE